MGKLGILLKYIDDEFYKYEADSLKALNSLQDMFDKRLNKILQKYSNFEENK